MASRERYQFGSFALDAADRRLTKRYQPIRLPPKTFDVLLELVRHAGRLVTKRELLQSVWPDAFVEEGILAVHVSTLRKTLDDKNRRDSSIETVSRSGYRFRSDVARVSDHDAISDRVDEHARSHPGEASIAVLPFVNLSADPENEYFSDGLTAEIIHTLSSIPGLRVIARTSAFAFKNSQVDIRRIAVILGVANVIEGSVRKASGRIRVTAQLISAVEGNHLWSGRYDREMADVFAMQDEIAHAITTALQITLLAEPVTRRYTPTVAAYEAFLKGVHHLNKMTPESMVRAREYLEEAIACDSRFADAYAALASYLIFLAANSHRPARDVIPLARAAAERALAIDPSLPEAHSVLGGIAAMFDFNWEEAERRQRLAMARRPISSRVRTGYARHLMLTGRARDGALEFERALERDPLDRVGRLFLANCLQAAGHAADAVAHIRQVLDLDENFWLAQLLLALNQMNQRMHADALVTAEKAYALAPWNSRVIGLLAGMLKRTGRSTRAAEIIRQLDAIDDGYGAPNARMLFHLACSEIDEGAVWAERAIEQRDPVAIIHLLGPDTQAWRSSARWPRLASMMRLPEAIDGSG